MPGEPWLAPMAGFTDLPFRILCRQLGASVACTEMISAKGVVFRNPSTERLLASSSEDAPLVVQLFGAEPEILGRAVRALRRRGFAWFDLNAGCPVKKVVRTGAGAALLKEPNRLAASVRRMVEAAGPGRVGVKIRSDWAEGRDGYLRLAERLGKTDLGWVTLHPRSARQGFAGRADWSQLGRLRQAVPFPVIGSGDFFSAADAWSCLRQTGITAIMFARGALQDPAVFARFKGETAPGPDSSVSWRLRTAVGSSGCRGPDGPLAGTVLARRHIDLCRRFRPTREGFVAMRPVVAKYLRSFRGVRQLRREVMCCRDWGELLELLDRLEAGLQARGEPNQAA